MRGTHIALRQQIFINSKIYLKSVNEWYKDKLKPIWPKTWKRYNGQSDMIQHKLLHDLSDEEFFVMKWPMLILHQKGMGEDGSHLGWGEKTNTAGVPYKGIKRTRHLPEKASNKSSTFFVKPQTRKKEETGENFISKLFIWWRSSHRSFLFLNYSPWLIYSSFAKCKLCTFKRGKIFVVEIFTKNMF